MKAVKELLNKIEKKEIFNMNTTIKYKQIIIEIMDSIDDELKFLKEYKAEYNEKELHKKIDAKVVALKLMKSKIRVIISKASSK